MIILDRVENLDEMTIQVELSEKVQIDKPAEILNLKKKVEEKLKSVLGVHANVELVNPGTIQRFEGKAKRIIDRRKI
ncbi:MAG: phenylacetate--CoA ligase, partial [Archaeoglobaceae archaeon]